MYEFSIGWFFTGLIIVALGVLFVNKYQWLADNFAGRVGSYEKFRLFAILTCIIGLFVMINLHSLILGLIVQAIFPQI